MGKRVHVIKKHEEYGNSEGFNWMSEEFFMLLLDLGCDMCHKEDDYDNFECEVEDYKTGLKLANAYRRKGVCESVDNMFEEAGGSLEDFDNAVKELGGIDYIIQMMYAFYRERDKKSDWISFSAW